MQTIGGLPIATAILYGVMFAVAFWFYDTTWTSAPIPTPDSPGYLRIAQDLSDFRIDQLNARPPGYPVLLVFTGSGRTLFWISLALHFASIWLLAAALYTMGLTGGWLVLSAVVLLLPPYVEYAAYLLADNLSEFFLVMSFSLLVLWFVQKRKGALLLSAIAIACSGLVRPTYQILALVVGAFFLIFRIMVGAQAFGERRWIKAGGILLAASAIFIGGYSFVNYVKFNFFGTYPMTGFNLTNLTTRFLERLPDQYMAEREALIKARDAQLIVRGGDHRGYDSFWRALPDLVKITGLAVIPDLSQHLLHLQLILIRKAPLQYLQEVLASFSSYWLPSATELANMNSQGVQAFWIIFHFALLTLFILQLVVITGLATFHITQRVFGGEISGNISPDHLFAYFLATTIVFYNAMASAIAGAPDPRYRIPTEPLIIFMCFLGFYLWRRVIDCTASSVLLVTRHLIIRNVSKNNLICVELEDGWEISRTVKPMLHGWRGICTIEGLTHMGFVHRRGNPSSHTPQHHRFDPDRGATNV